jgi:hypothetical protein
VRKHYGLDGNFFFSDILNAAKSEVSEGVYRTPDGGVSLRSLLSALASLPPHAPPLLPRIPASDGSTIFLSYKDGNLSKAEGVGVDGISRSVTLVQFNNGFSTYELFENAKRYLQVFDHTPFTRAGFGFTDGNPDDLVYPTYLNREIRGDSKPGKVYTLRLNAVTDVAFIDEFIYDDVKPDVVTDEQQGQINLKVPSFASLTSPFPPLFTTQFKDEFNRASYFTPLFKLYAKQNNAQAFSALQTVGLSYNSSPAILFSMPRPELVPMDNWEKGQAIAEAIGWGVFAVLGAVAVATAGAPVGIAAGIIIFFCGFDASILGTIIHHIGPPAPRPNPNPNPVPMPVPVPVPGPDPCSFCLPDQFCINGFCYDLVPPGGDKDQ